MLVTEKGRTYGRVGFVVLVILGLTFLFTVVTTKIHNSNEVSIPQEKRWDISSYSATELLDTLQSYTDVQNKTMEEYEATFEEEPEIYMGKHYTFTEGSRYSADNSLLGIVVHVATDANGVFKLDQTSKVTFSLVISDADKAQEFYDKTYAYMKDSVINLYSDYDNRKGRDWRSLANNCSISMNKHLDKYYFEVDLPVKGRDI